MESFLRIVTAALLRRVFVALYVAAKIHFFTRFGSTELDGCVSKHWPYLVGLAAMAQPRLDTRLAQGEE